MGVRERREREKEDLRRKILDAARELFLQEGYANVSMRRIAEKIEYSPTTIYLYFEDKEALMHAIIEATFARLVRKQEAIIRQTDDPLERLRTCARSYVEFGLKHPNDYRVAFMTFRERRPDKTDYLRPGSMGQKSYDYLRQHVRDCIDRGIFRETDADLISQVIWAGLHGLTSLFLVKPNFPWANRRRLVDTVVEATLAGLRA